jgi:hypothetical protein
MGHKFNPKMLLWTGDKEAKVELEKSDCEGPKARFLSHYGVMEYLSDIYLLQSSLEEGLLRRSVVHDAEGSLHEAHQSIESFLSEDTIAKVEYLLVDEVETAFESHDEFGLDEHEEHIDASSPLRCSPYLLVEIALLVLVIAPELTSHHIQFVRFEQQFVSEGEECALAPEGEEILGIWSM